MAQGCIKNDAPLRRKNDFDNVANERAA